MRKPKPSTSKPSSEELILPVVPVEDIPSQEATADVPSEPSVEKAPDMEASLAAIYQDQTGTVPDLSRLDRKRSKRWFWMITGGVILLACLALAAWTGFFLFQPYREFTGEGLRVKIDGPANMVLGKEETYTVTWSNQSVDPLSHAEIRVALPPDFVVTALSPEPSDRHLSLWKLGSLPPGGHGSISIQGVFVGALGTTSAIQVIGVYRPSGFGRDLEVLMNEPLVSTESVLEGVLQAPQKVLSGDTLSLVYTVTNRGTRPMKGLVAHLKFPRGFVLSGSATSTGPAATDEGFFPLEDLLPSATSSVRVAGAFTSEVSGDMLFEAEAGSRGADGKFLSAQKTEVHVPVLAGDLTLRFVANGSDTDRTIQPGDSLRVALAYQNTSPEPIKGVTLQVGVETFVNDRSATGTSLLDWTRLDDPSHGVTSTKPRIQTVSYTKTQIPQLEVLEPQAEGRVEFSLPTLAVASGTKDAWIRLTVQGVVSTVGGVKVNRMVHAQPINLHYRSDADVSVEARYFTEEGAPLGFGPLPPVAGKTTAYRVVWELTKTLHPLEQMTVTAVLPKAAAWSEKTIVDAGNMSYDAASRTVRWELRTVPQEVKDLQASFEIQLTPETLDIGRFANLLSETKFEAQDPVVNEAISRSKPPLTTDLQNDEGARGKGVVRKD